MFAFQAVLILAITALLCQKFAALAEPIRSNNENNNNANNNNNGNSFIENEFNTCEEQLSKYRRFLLQAILSFEDVCDAYNARPPPAASLLTERLIYRDMPPQLRDTTEIGPGQFFRNYQPPEGRAEIWAFFKLLMAQFNDVEYANVIRDAVIERCRVKSQLQHDEKRNSMVLGKKQRFHSWGGKRAPASAALSYSSMIGDHVAGNAWNDYFQWKKQTPKLYA